MSKHTPGPWRVVRQNGSPTTGEWMIAGSKHGYLAEVRDCGSGDVKANAHLIAAAPDLYDALDSLLSAIDSCAELTPQLLRAFEKTLAKARGEA